MPNESRADGAPEPGSPFPPAFRWETSTQEAPTQVMGAVGRDTALDEPAEQPPTDPPLPVGTPLGRLSDTSAPPWFGSEVPPIAEQQSDWLRLDPEEFQNQPPRSWSKRIIGIAVLAVVVLGLAVAAVMHSLAGGSPNRTGNDQITAPLTTAPSAQPVLPTVPAAAPPVTADAPVTTPAAPPAIPEASGNPEPPVTPAAPPPTGLAPNPPLHRSTGTRQGRAAAVPAPHDTGSPTSEAPPPPAPAPTSAPEGFTRVPSQPWHPQVPQ
ncbi:MAG: hypothetical protein ACRDRO_30675 [Pseudonocardiaceae bacterium]